MSIVSKIRNLSMDKDTTKSIFNEVLKQFPNEKFNALIKDTDADRYIKKLFTAKLLYILLIVQITQIESLRALAENWYRSWTFLLERIFESD